MLEFLYYFLLNWKLNSKSKMAKGQVGSIIIIAAIIIVAFLIYLFAKSLGEGGEKAISKTSAIRGITDKLG